MRALFVPLVVSATCLFGGSNAQACSLLQGANGAQRAAAPRVAPAKARAPLSKALAQRPAARVARAQAARQALGGGRRAGASFGPLLGVGPLVPGAQQAISLTTPQGAVAWLQRVAVPADRGFNLPSPFRAAFGEVFSITVPSTGLTEFFALHVPQVLSGQEAPLVVGFHGANTTYLDITRTTELVNEAAARDWFFLAPLQWSAVGNGQTHYGSVQSQLHVEALMDLLLGVYPIDLDRVYAVGFSMGGGAALSYGARHRDRETGAFAAIVNHTGTAALSHVYDSEPLIRSQMELLFGGAPSAAPFEYQRSSVIELDAAGLLLPQGRHMGVNLGAAPVQTWYATDDGLTYLQTQAIALDGFFQALPGATHQLLPVLADPLCSSSGLDGHCWSTLDPIAAYDWLEMQTLENDAPFGTVLADRGGRWGLYDVGQQTPGSFASFGFDVNIGLQSLTLSDLENVQTLGWDIAEHGFSDLAPISMTVNSIDGTGQVLEVQGFSARPSSLTRGGIGSLESCAGGSFPTWCYEPATGVVRITETMGGSATWTISP